MHISRRKLLVSAGATAAIAGTVGVTPMALRDGKMVVTRSRADPVLSDDVLPESSDVVIIGAGMIGIATALYLNERGLSVTICEKGEIACEQSSRSYGQVTSYGVEGLTEFTQHSKYLWRGMNEKIGADTTYRSYGRIQACYTDEDVERVTSWLKEAKQNAPAHAPIRARMIEGAELEQRMRGAVSTWKTALLQEDDGSVEPVYAAPALARYIRSRGVRIVTQCAVRGIDTQGGAVAGVITEKGATRAKQVLIAGGHWSRLMCGNYDIELPILPAYLSQQRLSAVDGPPACGSAGKPGKTPVVWRKEVGGTYSNGPRYLTAPIIKDGFGYAVDFLPELYKMMGGAGGLHLDFSLGNDFFTSLTTKTKWNVDEETIFEHARITAPTHNNQYLNLAYSWLKEEFPIFEQAQIIERWGGVVNVAKDLIPIVAPLEKIPGLFVSSGFDFGLMHGPAAGQLMADMMTGEKFKVDHTGLSYVRLFKK